MSRDRAPRLGRLLEPDGDPSEVILEGDECPACGDGEMVKRNNRQSGDDFLGCSNWPNCRHTEKFPETGPTWSRRDEGM